ncbi:putative phage abortive infection protein [Dysgonomonas sp. Marseille-Q5470]|uniref:putative phage abortive infection protein n=1 Tax=Dysgonomonas sp. Marseille-Q5470 TaxID=3039494 RepID=UPI0024BC86E9|nr:putative phage abortive infection protein [Dysgonomonas sp. Marseille-Q5470]
MKKKVIFIGIIALVGIVVTLLAPILFTRGLTQYDFTETGEIGDTIGGITAPIIGILSVIFLIWTLWEQIDFNKKQKNISIDEQFKSTFFNLLQVQRDIVNKISGKFTYVSKKDVTHIVTIKSNGLDFFSQARYQLFLIFKSLDNNKYINGYNDTNAQYAESDIENTWYRDYGGSDLPYDIEAMWNNYSNNTRMVHIIAYTSDLFGISKKGHENYQSLSINKQIGLGYAYFFNKYETIGYYFRHLYYILKFIKKNEDDKIHSLGDNPNQAEMEKIRNEYNLYAQFIQAQMSTDELLMAFYNSFAYPKAQYLIIHYNLLENLTIQNLIKTEHNCKPEIRLKDRRNVFTDLINNHDNTN